MNTHPLREYTAHAWMLSGALVLAMLAGSGCHSSDRVSQFAAGARREAGKWQADAELVEIHARTFQMIISGAAMKSGPPQIVTFYFFSPSTRRALHVDATTQGLQPHPDDLPFSPFTLPIPDTFAGLDAYRWADSTSSYCRSSPR
jgi:hypothetical protein